MKKYVILAIITGLAAAPAAAQANQVNPTTGFVTPSGVQVPFTNASLPVPFAWQADQAIDSITKEPGQVVEERASEAYLMALKNKSNAADRAIKAVTKASKKADSRNQASLIKAQEILSKVKQKTPDQANIGLNTAIRNVNNAKIRQPGSTPKEQPNDIPSPDLPNPAGR